MTFIFGARCSDEVVLVGDTMLPVTHDYAYGYKIFSVFGGVVTALAGDKGILELFKSNILDFVKSQESPNSRLSTQQFLLSISQISRQISSKQGRNFDILVAISGTLISGISSLRRIVPSGESMLISDYSTIGNDSPHATVFLKKLFRNDISTEQSAELGYFIIKYLDRFELTLKNGLLDTKPPFDRPIIWFIPDRAPDFMMTDRKILDRFESNATKRLDRLETNIVKAYRLS